MKIKGPDSRMPNVSRIGKTREIAPVSASSKILVPEMVRIPAGKFPRGCVGVDPESRFYIRYSDRMPVQEVTISRDFAIGKFEVTNAEWILFCMAIGKKTHKFTADPINARHPAVGMNWYEAVAYTRWLSKMTNEKYRLPTEAEWEYAARGLEGLKYPWGNEFDDSRVTFDIIIGPDDFTGTRPVDAHQNGVSPFGVWNLIGNVWEWISDWYAKYNPEYLIDPKGPERGTKKVIRGGSNECHYPYEYEMESSYRHSADPKNKYSDVGFRVAKDL